MQVGSTVRNRYGHGELESTEHQHLSSLLYIEIYLNAWLGHGWDTGTTWPLPFHIFIGGVIARLKLFLEFINLFLVRFHLMISHTEFEAATEGNNAFLVEQLSMSRAVTRDGFYVWMNVMWASKVLRYWSTLVNRVWEEGDCFNWVCHDSR